MCVSAEKGTSGRKAFNRKAGVAVGYTAQVCLTVSDQQLQSNGKRFGRKCAIM